MTSTESTLVGLNANVEVTAPSKRSWARPYLILALVASLALAAFLGFRFLTAGRESTDDAQVAADMVPVSARVGGTVIAVPVGDHQNVKKGDLLAEIDPADYGNKVKLAQAEIQAAVAQAEAADAQVGIVAAGSKGGLSTAQAALSGTISSVAGADAQIQAASAALARAQADADQADIVLKRAQALSKSEAIPQAELDSAGALAAAQHALVLQAQAQLAVASQARQAARSRIAEAQGRVEQSSPVESQQAAARANAELAHARVASAETALAQAQLNLSYTKVFAPGDGHISKLELQRNPSGQYAGRSERGHFGRRLPRSSLAREGREHRVWNGRAVLAAATGQRFRQLREGRATCPREAFVDRASGRRARRGWAFSQRDRPDQVVRWGRCRKPRRTLTIWGATG
jgi:membrane fusion protein (multidrug efflux system)